MELTDRKAGNDDSDLLPMGIAATYIVPHPPLIIPAVGRGGEKKIIETENAYDRVGKHIAEIAPDTIVIISPHSVMYSDYFHISPGSGSTGDFGRFGAPEESFDERYDKEFVESLDHLFEKEGFPAGTSGQKDRDLDHGTMVPLYFIRKFYKGGKIIRVGLSGLPLDVHYRLGTYIKQVAEELGRNTVVVASGDLSHKLKESGPYGFNPAGPEYDKRIMDVASRAAFSEMLDFDEDFLDRAAECGHRSFVIMAGTLDGVDVKAEVLSHQDVTGVGYGVCIFELEGKRRSRESSAYVRLARTAIERFVRTGKRLELPELSEGLLKDLPEEATRERAGAFVSVHRNGMLRGCIGTIGPAQNSIAEEIISNAISAVSRDPRFEKVSEDELSGLEIKVDILGNPEEIEGSDQLDVKRYGVIVTSGYKRGLLLPDLEGVDTVEYQIDIARRKGGISPDEEYRLQRFEVVRYR